MKVLSNEDNDSVVNQIQNLKHEINEIEIVIARLKLSKEILINTISHLDFLLK